MKIFTQTLHKNTDLYNNIKLIIFIDSKILTYFNSKQILISFFVNIALIKINSFYLFFDINTIIIFNQYVLYNLRFKNTIIFYHSLV